MPDPVAHQGLAEVCLPARWGPCTSLPTCCNGGTTSKVLQAISQKAFPRTAQLQALSDRKALLQQSSGVMLAAGSGTGLGMPCVSSR